MSKDNIYDNMQLDKIKQIKLSVEDNSRLIDNIVDDIIWPYCKDLDNYISFIADILKDGQNPPTASELDDFCLNLATYIYFAGGMCEQLGIRDDISRAVWKECYHTARTSQDRGTIADKDSLAELSAQQEQLTNICYKRAYAVMKAKVSNAQEMLASIKKVISRRMQEQELTNLGGSGR